jgi:hypothetical protein
MFIGQPIDVSLRAELRVEQLNPAEEEARLPELLSLKYCDVRYDVLPMSQAAQIKCLKPSVQATCALAPVNLGPGRICLGYSWCGLQFCWLRALDTPLSNNGLRSCNR